MIVSYLILVMGVLVVFQPTPTRQKVAAVFVGATLLHGTIGEWLDGFTYYASAALFDVSIITITANFKHTCRLTRDIHRVCLVSVVLNMSGWAAYMSYLSPAGYNLSFIFLYIWSIMLLLRKDQQYYGDNKIDRWAYFFRFSSYVRPYSNEQRQRKE